MSTTKFVSISLAMLILVVLMLCLVVLIATEADAQDLSKPEIRVVNHWQHFADTKNIGFAAYVNEPDVTRGGPRVFGVAGIAFRNKAKTKWLEIMGGGLINRNGLDPALDIRGQTKLHALHGFTLWGEYMHLFKSDRTLLSGSVTKTLHKRFKLGAESDTWKQKVGGGTGVGPGAGMALTPHLQIWSAYQFGIGKQRDVWRTYFVINW